MIEIDAATLGRPDLVSALCAHSEERDLFTFSKSIFLRWARRDSTVINQRKGFLTTMRRSSCVVMAYEPHRSEPLSLPTGSLFV
jgi:hypothetical protein